MNLLRDDWISIRRRSGSTVKIAPVRLTAGGEDPAVEIEAPRADFRGALYQFLIGILQTVLAPRDLRDWRKLWDEPPGEEELHEAFKPFVHAFEFDCLGPAFMQDFDLPIAEPVGIAALLIDAPGEKTITDNKDHFVHRNGVQSVCRPCAATALFTLQINAPAGGVGHRVSVRGGGPLTTLLVPDNAEVSLWRRVWLNVLPTDALAYSKIESVAEVLPWMGPTRTSETGGAGDTTPDTAHRLQAYWSMPRRVRLDLSGEEVGVCDLCGKPAEKLVRRYRTKNYGVNYTGAWLHPLSPYNYDPKGEKPPLAVKGQPGGIGYRHWLGLTMGNRDQMPDAAVVVKYFMSHQGRLPDAAQRTRLWCFGYDLDNMKARCWYDSTLPVYGFANDRQRERFVEATEKLLDAAEEAASALHKCVKQAWFKRPGDAGNEPAVPQSFWQRSENEFYRALRNLADADLTRDEVLIPAYGAWLRVIERTAVDLFDEWVLAAPVEGMNMARLVEARTALLHRLRNSGAAKQLWRMVKEFEEVKA